MAEVKWIKIVTDIFDDEKILLIESMPEADSIIVIWFKLLILAGKTNNKGVFLISDKIAYTDEMLATIFRRKLTTVRLALQTFEQFGMIEIVNDVITIPNWSKHQSMDLIENRRNYQREYMAKKRSEQKMIANANSKPNSKPNCETTVNPIEEEIEIEEDIDNTIDDYLTLFELFWKAYPRKESKEKTKIWFKKNKPNEKLFDQIMESLEKFKKTKQWQDKQYVPHPTTWLNQKRWEDEVNLATGSNKKVASVPEWYGKYKKQLENLPKQEKLSPEEAEKILQESKSFD